MWRKTQEYQARLRQLEAHEEEQGMIRFGMQGEITSGIQE